MTDKVAYWTDLADYDFETAVSLQRAKRYLYVGFMCHQVIEKMLKAYWAKVLDETPLKIHTLNRLAEKSGLDKIMNETQLEFIDKIQYLNIECRYPEYKEALLKSLTQTYCENLLETTDELRKWIKERL